VNHNFSFRRRSVLAMAALGALGTASALAQTADTGTLLLVVPYPAGAGGDLVARTLQPSMGKALGRNMIVENVGGVAGALGVQKVLAAPPNGQTMLLGSPSELITTPLALKAARYRPQDLRLVSLSVTAPLVIFARPDLPANNLDELLKLAKAPGAKPLSYGSAGKGSLFHLAGADFAHRLGLEMTHVPYRGAMPALQDLGGSVIDLAFFPLVPQFLQMIEAGRMKALAVMAPKRSPALPKVQITSDLPQLKDFHFESWAGILVSPAVSEEMATRISKAANDGALSDDFKRLSAMAGSTPVGTLSLAEAGAFYKREIERYQAIARSIQLEAE
jgi:tripartite-type tricarboxylate transporter receptor subunit TctC